MSSDEEQKGVLYVVGTPIGNLEDITPRALRTLNEVAVVFAEDTRVTKKLFDRYAITTRLERCDAQVEAAKIDAARSLLDEGKKVAFVSDAGTPGVSDPGARLVHAVREAGYPITVIPGPSAVTAALSIAGVSADSFVFLGYPPHKKGRKTFFEELGREKRTVVFFESTHRILKALAALSDVVVDRQILVLRELTKIHEEVIEGRPEEVLEILEQVPEKQKGEFVVIVPLAA